MLSLNIFGIIILLGAIQGFVLVFALSRIKHRNESANRFLKMFILLISLTMVGRILLDTQFKDSFPNFLALPDAVIFLYGPTLYFYLRKLLIAENKNTATFYVHLIPALLFIVSELPLYLNEENTLRQLWQEYSLLRGGLAEVLAWIHNMIYATLSILLFVRYQKSSNNFFSFRQYPPYLKSILFLIAILLIAWGYSCFSWIVGNYSIITALGYRTVWILLPFITYVLGYFAMYQPELFKIPQTEESKKPKPVKNETNEDDLLKTQIHSFMVEQKPYLNSKLNLGQLAEMLGLTPHVLSKTINTNFEKNFNDFVNSYRVDEFKKISVEDRYANMTVLAIAFDAGFNSKTTFNTAFKKITHSTPNEYLKNQREKVA